MGFSLENAINAAMVSFYSFNSLRLIGFPWLTRSRWNLLWSTCKGLKKPTPIVGIANSNPKVTHLSALKSRLKCNVVLALELGRRIPRLWFSENLHERGAEHPEDNHSHRNGSGPDGNLLRSLSEWCPRQCSWRNCYRWEVAQPVPSQKLWQWPLRALHQLWQTCDFKVKHLLLFHWWYDGWNICLKQN